MSGLVTQHALPPALDSLVCSLTASHRNGVLSTATLGVIIEQMQMAKWYARITGGREAAIAEVDLAVATERLSHAATRTLAPMAEEMRA